MPKLTAILLLIITLISCQDKVEEVEPVLEIAASENESYLEAVKNYNSLKNDLLNKTIEYFLDNQIIDENIPFNFFTYPYFTNSNSIEIRNGKPIKIYFPPFKYDYISEETKHNSLMIVGLQIDKHEESIYSMVGVVHIDNEGNKHFYGFDFELVDNEWNLITNVNSEMEEYYFFDGNEVE